MAIRNVTVRSERGRATYAAILAEHPDHTRYQHDDCWEPIWMHLAPPDDIRLPMPPVALLTIRCGMCPPCRQHRARRIIAKAAKEAETAGRVWEYCITRPPEFFADCTTWDEKVRKLRRETALTRKRGRQRLVQRQHKKRRRELERELGPEWFPITDREHRRIDRELRKRHVFTFRWDECIEEHNAKRTPDGKPTPQTGNPHSHMTIYEYPGHRISNDELELWDCNFPKFHEIPAKAEDALQLATANGWKQGNVEAHLEATSDPRDRTRSNAYGRSPGEAVAYQHKYQTKDAWAYEENPEQDPNPFRKPPPWRASLFFGRGWERALGLQERSKVCAAITRRQTAEAKPSVPQSCGRLATARVAETHHCQLVSTLQGAVPLARHEPMTPELIEQIMGPIRQRYIEKRRPLIMASAEAIRRARDGPDATG
jgi:hypothetical protein